MRTFHESDDQLELYALDRLPDDAVERIEEHLILCDPCRMRLEEIGSFALTMRQALVTKRVSKPWRRSGWFEGLQLRLAFSGAIAFAVLLAFFATKYGAKKFERGIPPVASLTLTALRGETASVASAQQLDLQLAGASSGGQDSGQRPDVEIVDDAGKSRWTGPADGGSMSTTNTAHVRVPVALEPGTYFVRLKKPGGELIHEYGFVIKK